MSEADIEAGRLARSATPQGFELWRCHWPAFRLFRAMQRQWRCVPIGLGGILYIGLDLTPLPGVAQALGIELDDRLLAQLQVMDVAGCEWLNKQGR